MPKSNYFFSKEDEIYIINFYQSGDSVKEISRKFKCSHPAVTNVLNRNNIQKRTKEERKLLKMPKDEDVVKHYLSTRSHKETLKEFNIGYITLQEILKRTETSVRDCAEACRTYYHNYDYFENIDSKDKAYFLGWLVSDGNVTNNTVKLALASKDKNILKIYKKYINYTGEVGSYKNDKVNYLAITHSKIVKDLLKWGVIPNKTHCTYFPPIKEEFWSHFIRGVFDGDGCIYVNSKSRIVCSFSIIGNITLITKIQKVLVENCNLNFTKFYHNKLHPENIVYLQYQGRMQILKIYNWLYKDCNDLFLIRKREKFKLLI